MLPLAVAYLHFLVLTTCDEEAGVNRIPGKACDCEFVSSWGRPIDLEQGIVGVHACSGLDVAGNSDIVAGDGRIGRCCE